MNKRILALFCAVAAACSLSACGNNNQNSSSTVSNPQSTTSEPQTSSSTAESDVSSSEVKDGTETLADGSILTIKGDTVTLRIDCTDGKELITWLFKNDSINSCEITFTSEEMEGVEAVLKQAEKNDYEVVKNEDNSITIKANDKTITETKEISKAELVKQIKEDLNMKKTKTNVDKNESNFISLKELVLKK